ncbi:MAG: biopolymer transporter ExbD [Planctomycetes bacterium]|nr:biopolymer transporter ExbD [Planctomycetota bacterium]
MQRRRRFHRPPSGLNFNFTPLIDVMVLLTIFFMLVAKFTSAEQVTMELPHPEDSRGRAAKMPERVVINCRLSEDLAAGEAPAYSIGPNQPEPLAAISQRLAAMKRAAPDFKVVIRADRRLAYRHVRAVMRALAENGVGMLNVAVLTAETD